MTKTSFARAAVIQGGVPGLGGVFFLMLVTGLLWDEGALGYIPESYVIADCCIAAVVAGIVTACFVCLTGDLHGASPRTRASAATLGLIVVFLSTVALGAEVGTVRGRHLGDKAITAAWLAAGVSITLITVARLAITIIARRHPWRNKIIGRRDHLDVEMALLAVGLASILAGRKRADLYEQWLADLRELVLQEELQGPERRRARERETPHRTKQGRRLGRMQIARTASSVIGAQIDRETQSAHNPVTHMPYAIGCIRAAVRMRVVDAVELLGRSTDRFLESELAVEFWVLINVVGSAIFLFMRGGLQHLVENAENVGAVGAGSWALAAFARRLRGISVKRSIIRKKAKKKPNGRPN